MAKLSEQRKVELLEAAVLANDIPAVHALFDAHGSFEFTARALGLACRFCGFEMVEALVQRGVTFNYEATANLKRKYHCCVSLSNSYDEAIRYVCYLFPEFPVAEYEKSSVSDEVRKKIAALLVEKELWRLDETLYYAIMYDDQASIDALREAGVQKFSQYRTTIVAGLIPTNKLDGYGRTDRNRFCAAALCKDSTKSLRILNNCLLSMDVEKINFFKSELFYHDFTSGKDYLNTAICSPVLFDFFIHKTNLMERAKKWDMLQALVDENNAAGMQYALQEGFAEKPQDLDRLLKYAQEKADISTELIAYILEKKNGTKGAAPSTKITTLDKAPTAAELKKLWSFKKQADGTLMITSYKGDATDIVIPQQIGKDTVTAIDRATFSTNAPRINEVQSQTRQAITSVEFPGTIKLIPMQMFYDGYAVQGHKALTQIILNEGTERIEKEAFSDCSGLLSITLPESLTEIGESAFSGCSSLNEIALPTALTALPRGVFRGCGFEQFAVPDTVTSIGDSAFNDCVKLCSVTLPESIGKIPGYLFSGCASIKTVSIPSCATAIGDRAFARSGLETIHIPDQVTEIGYGAFQGCVNLKEITLPEGILLGKEAFAGCDLLAKDGQQIVVHSILFGLTGVAAWGMSKEQRIAPLLLSDEVKQVAVSRDELPEIVCYPSHEAGSTVDVNALAVGDTLSFGRFPTEEDYLMQPLRWRVLAVEDGKALLITEQEIISLHRDTVPKDVWATSPVRKLLNDGFLHTAFTPEEQTQILTTTVHTPKNKDQRVDGGPDTEDRVFLLSLDEVEQYMPQTEDRKATATVYAHKQHPTKRDWGFWQLRTPGKDNWGSVAVSEGSGDYSAMTGNHVGYSYIRPAIWIKNP